MYKYIHINFDGSNRSYFLQIQYWRTSNKLTSFSEANVFMEHIIPQDSSLNGQSIESEFRLSNLYPYSSMEVQVRVMNNYYVGPASDLDSFTTLEGGLFLPFTDKRTFANHNILTKKISRDPSNLLCTLNHAFNL